MIEILVVEDDPILGRGLQVSLEVEGYKVLWVRDFKTASNVEIKSKLNLIILDLNLPDGNGLDLLQNIRKSDIQIPIIILTAKTDEDSVVEGLQLGANDYVRKPFGNKELLARIKIAIKEPRKREQQIRYGELLILIDQRRVMLNDQEIVFERREFDIFNYFVQHSEMVVTRKTLLDFLGQDNEIYDRTIDSHISHIRTRLRKAGVKSIQLTSVYGVGYRLENK
ncbi:MAG: response regulator transcription factor [Oligoflexia bacterium]|nr:response regulator transcription factor [Oligoflexia bacterium]MBF0364712.1 response regulator transcription factor [Oligoflexia bacterium]